MFVKPNPRREAELFNFIRKGLLMKFYKSKEWMKLRQQALQRDNYECQICRSKGRYHKAENVHHRKEVKTHPHLSLELSNLQCLCIRCHNDVHKRLDAVQKTERFVNEERW